MINQAALITHPRPTPDDVSRTLAFLHTPRTVFEVCLINPQVKKHRAWGNEFAGGKKPIIAGWFDDPGKAAKIIRTLDEQVNPAGVYVTLNPCDPALLGRANNRLKPNVSRTTDKDITRLCHLLIDVDPQRPAGVSSSEDEKEAAKSVTDAAYDYLKGNGWPEPLRGDSGNGYHLIYPLDLANNPDNVALVKAILQDLDARFSNDKAKVDTTVSNPARISKVYGTTARKGDSTPDRPHRKAYILSIPDNPQPVQVELLQQLAAEMPTSSPVPSQAANYQNDGTQLDVEAYLNKNDIPIKKIKPHGSSTLYILDTCVFDSSHTNGEAAIGQTAEGKLFYQCFHDSCSGRTWRDARQVISGDALLFEPSPLYSGSSFTATTQTADERHLGHLSPAPIEVFPLEVQGLIEAAVETFGTTAEAVIGAILAISGGLIGARRLLKIKPQWTPHAALYLLTCAPTGDSKSPAINWLMEPVEAKERLWLREWRDQMAFYEEEMKNRKKEEPKPEKPIRKQIKVGDITTEALIDALDANPGGLIRYRDEGRAFFTDADKYTNAKGSDQTKYLEAYDRRPIQVDRVQKDRVSYVHRPCITLFGSIPPKILTSCFSDLDTASGYLGRWIIIHSKQIEPALWSEKSMSPSDVALWHSLVEKFTNLDMEEDEHGWFDARKIDPSRKAKDVYIEYYNQMTQLPFMEPDVFREIIPKAKEHALRLCLILHCIEHAVAGTDEMASVTESTMKKAVKLAEWTYAHNVRTWQMIVDRLEEPDRQPVERRIAQAIFDLKNQIKNSTLTTAEITEKVNNGHPENFHLSSDSVGKLCSKRLNLAKNKSHGERGWQVDQAVVERLQNNFSLVPSVLSAPSAPFEPEKTLDDRTHRSHGTLSTYPKTKNGHTARHLEEF